MRNSIFIKSRCNNSKNKVFKDIFQTFFSYLPEDVEILLAEEPDNRKYQDWQNWLKKNYEELQQLILSEESEITMGMQILSCEKGSL